MRDTEECCIPYLLVWVWPTCQWPLILTVINKFAATVQVIFVEMANIFTLMCMCIIRTKKHGKSVILCKMRYTGQVWNGHDRKIRLSMTASGWCFSMFILSCKEHGAQNKGKSKNKRKTKSATQPWSGIPSNKVSKLPQNVATHFDHVFMTRWSL